MTSQYSVKVDCPLYVLRPLYTQEFEMQLKRNPIIIRSIRRDWHIDKTKKEIFLSNNDIVCKNCWIPDAVLAGKSHADNEIKCYLIKITDGSFPYSPSKGLTWLVRYFAIPAAYMNVILEKE